ncbi:2-succinyl-5-enolpyruvyl-6-hydroxy-3-cyclohexene-1-carboxylic-acid synthase [Kurthia massiliensis]|uniref:2-succinyl-5-enolpyruvyl-6-hydroxy-3- cyclohexene-1-carboxylic-acid synthase n=1 Tax=Kurthia massiliensis TaxID=1033739 RepID=UPI0002896FDF|nr:2-succinyl-5-enolpyruvyl-6-hydroxy-3-cyclohexene-1-carboxylic-acid synthase [Kurthia massiliensis]
MSKQSLTEYVYNIVATLYAAGVKKVVVSPGSRSTPLAYGFASTKEFEMYRHVDERSAAFLALGLAKESAEPVVLVCTSGTAAANYFPAIVEAYYARLPLIVLTADRPHELREVGAPQAIAQANLYGHHVKWAIDLPIPEETAETLPFVERHIARAVAVATQAPFGPVQLNVPFREPLLIDFKEQLPARTFQRHFGAEVRPSQSALAFLTETMNETERGFIIIGETAQNTDIDALWQFVRAVRWPVLVESLSHMRTNVPADCAQYVIDQYDAILKNDTFMAHMTPQTVVRFGAQPVSKPLMKFLTAVKPMHYIVIDEDPKFRDSLHVATTHIEAAVGQWLTSLVVTATTAQTTYVEQWQRANDIATKHTDAYIEQQTDEGALAGVLFNHLPNHSDLIAGSSMPIRDVDTFFNKTDRDIRIFCNRGTNGIDGVVSTAFGLQYASKRDTYLLIGDLSFLHDTNGLIASRYQQSDLTIIVMNNDGGGIFSYLPQASVEAHYEELFGTPTALGFEHLAAMYDADYAKVTTKDELVNVLQTPKQKAIRIVEVMTNRADNITTHRKLWQNINKELDTLWQA